MPGFTTPDGFIFEVPGDQPLISLTGGSSSTFSILAEQVQTKITDLEVNVVGGIDSRVAVLEAVPSPPSWVAIQSGSVSNTDTFVIAGIPTGAYRAVRLHLYGTNETTVDPIRIRFNSDNTAGLHKSGYVTRDANGAVQFSNFGDSEFWEVATWRAVSGCSAEITIFETHVSDACAFMARGSAPASTAAGHQYTDSWGRLNSNRLLDSLRVSGPSGANFTATWWLEGSPA